MRRSRYSISTFAVLTLALSHSSARGAIKISESLFFKQPTQNELLLNKAPRIPIKEWESGPSEIERKVEQLRKKLLTRELGAFGTLELFGDRIIALKKVQGGN